MATGTYRNYARSHKYDAHRRRLDFRLIAVNLGTLAGKRVLEVGCGLGGLLDVFRSCGCECVGIELDPDAANEVRRRLGIVVCEQPLEKANIGPFEVVVAEGVLEHIAQPRSFLDAVTKVLVNGGLFWVGTPNWECASAHGRDWIYWYGIFEHLCYFSPATLRVALRKRGLVPVCEGSSGPRAGRKGRARRTRIKALKEFLKDIPAVGRALLHAKRGLFPERLAPLNTDLADYVGLFRKAG